MAKTTQIIDSTSNRLLNRFFLFKKKKWRQSKGILQTWPIQQNHNGSTSSIIHPLPFTDMEGLSHINVKFVTLLLNKTDVSNKITMGPQPLMLQSSCPVN